MSSASAMTYSTRGLRTACLIFIVLGLLAAGFALALRVSSERSSRAVDLVIDYNEAVALAGRQGAPFATTLLNLRDAGATAVALPEDTLASLAEQGTLRIAPRPGETQGHYFGWDKNDPVFTIETPTLQINRRVFAALQRVYPVSNLRAEAPFRILVRGDQATVSALGLGLDPVKVSQITGAGLRIVPRLQGGAGISGQSLAASLAEVRREAGVGAVIVFDGTTIPGYRDLLEGLADQLNKQNLVYGAIEFGKQKGDAQLGGKLDGHLVRVHSISLEELSTMTTPEVVQRFTLAVKDRNIRVLYVHLPPLAADNAQTQADDYLGAIKHGVTQAGFTISDAKAAHPFTPLHVPWPVLGIIFAAAIAALVLWIATILPEQLPRLWITIGYLVLALGTFKAFVLASGAIGISLFQPAMGRAGFGLVAAIAFAMLAMTWAYRQMNRLSKERPARMLLRSVGILAVTTLITLAGGLLVAAMLSETRYLVKVGQFVGVKAALAVPLLLLGAIFVCDGVARPGETMAAYWDRCKAGLKAFAAQPVFLWGILVALVALVAVGILLARSGNEGVQVSTFELQTRSLLEQWMVARPRTKEFLFGHPLFIFSMVAASRGYRTLALFLLLGGAIGQVDVLNTYCHAHTPVLMSLLRSFNGLWLGILIGVVVLAIFARRAIIAKQAAPVAVPEE